MIEDEIIITDEPAAEDIVVEIEDTEAIEIEVDEVFVSLDGSGQQFNHAVLNNREMPNQHPIIAIEGLREELDRIEALQTVYSDKRQQADYYKWRNDALHHLPVNPYGLFVSICDNTDHIQICDGSTDVFGVTVDGAAFIGNQEYSEVEGGAKSGRDGTYCPVVCYGSASVRRESTVEVGDYVVPNMHGEAKKSSGKYGYLVTALAEKHGVLYAVISLKSPSTIAKTIADGVEDLTDRMRDAEYNIASAINVANTAYASALAAKEKADSSSKYTDGQISSALGEINKINQELGTLASSVDKAGSLSAQAHQIAVGVQQASEKMQEDVADAANDANARISALIEKYEPLEVWIDDNTKQINYEYVAKYMNENGLATKAEVQKVESDTERAFLAIEQNAQNMQTLLSSIATYSVGEYSQAYGLTHDQAKRILENGMVYVPTEQYHGLYIKDSNGNDMAQFMTGYYYTWNGEYWVASDDMSVIFVNMYVRGSNNTPYWVVTLNDVVYDNVAYELGGLYHWEENVDGTWGWIKVASTEVNMMSRVVSSIRQTSNSISASVANMTNSVAGLEAKVENSESKVTTLASHVLGKYESVKVWNPSGKYYDTIYFAEQDGLYRYWNGTRWVETNSASDAGLPSTLATIEQKANENGASISQIVTAVGTDGNVTASSIVQAINNRTGDSLLQIDANHINLNGRVTFDSFDDDTKYKIEADSIDVQIWSSNGNIFKSRDVSTVLTCRVFKAGEEVTNIDNRAFKWIKLNKDGEEDTSFVSPKSHKFQISHEDVLSRAVFTCEVDLKYIYNNNNE